MCTLSSSSKYLRRKRLLRKLDEQQHTHQICSINGPRQSQFSFRIYMLPMLESCIVLVTDLLALLTEIVNRKSDALVGGSCSQDVVIYRALHHTALVTHVAFGLHRAGIFRILYIPKNEFSFSTLPVWRRMCFPTWWRAALFPSKAPAPARPAHKFQDKDAPWYCRHVPLQVFNLIHGVGYLIELSRRFFYVAWPLAAILVESRELALACSAASIQDVHYVPDPLGRGDFRRWIRDFVLIQLGTTIVNLINLSIILQTFRFVGLHNTITVLYNTHVMGRRQLWSFSWLVLGSAVPWAISQYPGLAIHSFVCRMYVLVQLMCLDNIGRFSPYCHILRHMLWPSSGVAYAAAPQPTNGSGGGVAGDENEHAQGPSRRGIAATKSDWGMAKSLASIGTARIPVPVVVGTNRVGSVTLPPNEPHEPLRRHGSQRGAHQDAPLAHHSLLSPPSPSGVGSMAFASPLGSHATFQSAQSNQSGSVYMPNAMAARQLD